MTSQLRDPARLGALAATGLVDSGPEESFDRLTRLVSRVTGAPVALVSLVDDRRQFFKSLNGLGGDAGRDRQTPLTHSFCQLVVIDRAPLVVTDAENDPRVCDNLAIPDLGVKAYLGVPLTLPSGQTIGSLCAIDTTPRAWNDDDLASLHDIAAVVISEIGLRDEIMRRVAAESNQALLIAELHHRVKNTLSTVQALVQLSPPLTPEMQPFRDNISARIVSLANTHSLLTREQWNVIDIRDIVRSELAPFGEERVTLDGPALTVASETATALGMVIHELATNAAKYGALSCPGGSLEVRWRVAQQRLSLSWRERGVTIAAPPTRTGFGSRLIDLLLVRQLRGDASADFTADGLAFSASVPLPDPANSDTFASS